jgi:hypothetical protein
MAGPSEVVLLNQDGRRMAYPADVASRLVAKGTWRQETAEEAAQRAFARENPVASPVGAFVGEGLSAATLGLSDVAGEAIGGEDFADFRRRSAEDSPLAGGLGTVAGVVAPAVLTGGGSTLAQGATRGAAALARGATSTAAKVVSAPARAALGIGQAVEQGAARGLARLGVTGESLAGRATLGAGKMAAGGAAEGAIFGAGEALSEAALAPGGDYNGLAEKLWAGAGEGAKFGALTGGVLGGLGGVGSKAIEKLTGTGRSVDDIIEEATPGMRPPGVVEDVVRNAPVDPLEAAGVTPAILPARKVALDFEARLSPPKTRSAEEAAAAFGPTNLSAEARSGRQMYAEADDILESASRDLRDNMAGLIKSTGDVTEEVVHRQLKRAHVAKNLGDIDSAAAIEQARGMAKTLRERALEMGGKRGQDLADWAGSISKAADSGDAADVYMAMDNARRQLYKRSLSVSASARRQTSFRRIEEAESLAKTLKQSYLESADALMSPVWGKQGAAQKSANQAWVRYIKAKDAAFGKIATQVGKDIDGLPVHTVDSAKVASYVKQLGRFEGETTDQQIREFLVASRELTEAIGDGYALPGTKAASLASMRDATEKIATTLQRADKTVRTVNEIDQLVKGAEVDRALGNMSPGSIVGTIAGGIFGGGAGAVIGGMAGAAMRPGALIPKLAAAESTVARLRSAALKTDSKIAKSVRSWFERSKPGKERRSYGLIGAASSLRTDRALERKAGESRADAYFRKVATIEQEANAPERAPHPDAPETSRAMEAVRKTAASFLLEKAPMGSRRYSHPVLARVARQRPPDEGQMREFARYVETVENPMTVLDALEEGRLNRQQVEALKAVYPSLYNDVRRKAYNELVSRGDDMAHADRVQLGTLLGIVADPSMRPQSLRLGQAALANGPKKPSEQAAQQGASGGNAPKLSISEKYAPRSEGLDAGMEVM